MPHEEVYNSRDRAYSAWHRRMSLRRFIGIEKAQLATMIDLDASLYVEYDDGTKEPLALIETAVDCGQSFKPATVTTNLAMRADIPALVVLYTLSDRANPADPMWKDIEGFRVQRLYPNRERRWRNMTPDEYAKMILDMRLWSANRIDSILDNEAA